MSPGRTYAQVPTPLPRPLEGPSAQVTPHSSPPTTMLLGAGPGQPPCLTHLSRGDMVPQQVCSVSLRVLCNPLTDEGKQKSVPQNSPLWHKEFFELIILSNSRCRRSSENTGEVPFGKGKFAFTKASPWVKVCSTQHQRTKRIFPVEKTPPPICMKTCNLVYHPLPSPQHNTPKHTHTPFFHH